MDFLQIPNRTKRDRTYGLTLVADFGTSTGELKNILNDHYSLFDFAKIGVGTAYVTPKLEQKIEMYKQFGIKPYCGGTFFEKCYQQQKLGEYIAFLKEVGIDWIEVSNGTLNIPLKERISIVEELKDHFFILGEVGSKDPADGMSAQHWREELQVLLESGCSYVITEGRASGSSGIYTDQGDIKSELIEEVVMGLDRKKVIFEASKPSHQMYFIKKFGANVNLGNVDLHDLVLLETQRCGLRSETFFTFDEIENTVQEG